MEGTQEEEPVYSVLVRIYGNHTEKLIDRKAELDVSYINSLISISVFIVYIHIYIYSMSSTLSSHMFYVLNSV